MSMKYNQPSLQRLKQVLEAYGGNPDRWPEAEREGLLALLRGNAEAGSLHTEQKALDAALDAPAAPAAPEALRASILKIAVPAAPAKEAEIIPFRKAPPSAKPAQPAGGPFFNWQTAALLAASLLIGVWIGAGGINSSLVSESLNIASMQGDSETYDYNIGLTDAEELL